MPQRCQYVEYLVEKNDKEFDTSRAYCTATERFVQPMRADICNRRYDLEPTEDCEYYDKSECSPSEVQETE